MDTIIQSCSPEIWGGFECTINRVQDKFFDQLDYSGHYGRQADIDAVIELGIKKLRYPVLWEKHEPSKQKGIDWTHTEKNLLRIKEKNIDIIAGLLHHGSGPAFTNLADPSFPSLLAHYAKKVAQKYPWIEYYTPVNEPLTTARLSGLYGLWYPHKRNARAFMQMLLNQLKGVILSMKEIRKINPKAQLVQTEDLCKVYSTPGLQHQANFENERRWLTYDLLCGMVDIDHSLWDYLNWLKISKEDVLFFKENQCIPQIFGFNHYVTSERFLDGRLHLYPPHTYGGNGRKKYADVEAVRVPLNEESGIELLVNEAWSRYKQPIAITEVHLHCHREEQLRWFQHIWTSCQRLKNNGVDIKGVTAWALTGSYGWNKLLIEPKGDYEPGVFDVRSGKLRTTALTSFIKKISCENILEHPVCSAEGWWKRSTRFSYEEENKSHFQIKRENTSAPILIIGKRGTLGNAFKRICNDRHLHYHLLSRGNCNISDMNSVEAAIEFYKPWAIINAAGYVRVDDAENDSDACFNDNTIGPHNLAIACNKYGIKLVSFSSDLVFDGNKNTPYIESDTVNPLNVYGKSKAEAEQLILKENANALVIRTSAFFGPWDEYNFFQYVQKSLSEFKTITVANDILISPTYIPDLVNVVLDLTIDDEKNIWHLVNEGETTWADLAFRTADAFELDKNLIISIPNNEMQLKAKRPAYSVLTSERSILLPALDDAMNRYYQHFKQPDLLSRIA